MTRVAEQEIKDTLKKSEFRGMVATIASTVTVLVGMFFGGLQIVDAVKNSIRIEVDAKINEKLGEFEKRQILRDNSQDADTRVLEQKVMNLSNVGK